MPETQQKEHWRGHFIVIFEDRTWEYCNCVRCGSPLTDEKSRQEGFGPECIKHYKNDSLLNTARFMDRQRAKEDQHIDSVEAMLARRSLPEKWEIPF